MEVAATTNDKQHAYQTEMCGPSIFLRPEISWFPPNQEASPPKAQTKSVE